MSQGSGSGSAPPQAEDARRYPRIAAAPSEWAQGTPVRVLRGPHAGEQGVVCGAQLLFGDWEYRVDLGGAERWIVSGWLEREDRASEGRAS